MALRKEDLYDGYDKGNRTMKRTRITIDVSPELRKRIKKAATEHELSISEYLGRILDEALPQEINNAVQEEYRPLTPEYLEQIHRVRERIIRESKGQAFEDSAEAVRKMREERTNYLEELREQP